MRLLAIITASLLPLAYSHAQLAVGEMPRFRSSGAYYHRPQGAYYVGAPLRGEGSLSTTLVVCPWQTVTFANADPAKDGEWHLWSTDDDDKPVDIIGEGPASPEGGDLLWCQSPASVWPTPTLTVGDNSFTIGDENYYSLKGNDYLMWPGQVMAGNGPVMMTAFDPNTCIRDNGEPFLNLARWGYVGDNIYGTGTLTTGGRNLVSWGAFQPMPRPMSPLYVEQVCVEATSYSEQPIADGDTLYCYISRAMRSVNALDVMGVMPNFEFTDTLYALAGDTIDFVTTTQRGSGDGRHTIHVGKILFHKHVTDTDGTTHTAPFVLHPDNYDDNGFVFVITGFHRKGIDVGIDAAYINTEVEDNEQAQMMLLDPNTGYSYFLNYGSPFAMRIGMMAMYDAVIVDPARDFITVAPDGAHCQPEWTTVRTARPWYDGNTACYTIEGLPEWVTDVKVDAGHWADWGDEGACRISFTCRRLPADTDSRTATLYIKGCGVTSATPITIHQDHGEGIATIHNKPRSNAAHHVSGIAASTHTQGIVVEKGRKYIRKKATNP